MTFYCGEADVNKVVRVVVEELEGSSNRIKHKWVIICNLLTNPFSFFGGRVRNTNFLCQGQTQRDGWSWKKITYYNNGWNILFQWNQTLILIHLILFNLCITCSINKKLVEVCGNKRNTVHPFLSSKDFTAKIDGRKGKPWIFLKSTKLSP